MTSHRKGGSPVGAVEGDGVIVGAGVTVGLGVGSVPKKKSNDRE
jgi:hypothetical protein